MKTAWAKLALFVACLLGLFMWAGEVVTRASGTDRRTAVGEGVSVANGESIFWGPGKCHTCHAVGGRGRSVRGPNLGESADGPVLALRADERARERAADRGSPMTPGEYLVESVANPSAYVVRGYKDEMPRVFEPPISLSGDQVTAVLLYLQSIGGTPDVASIDLPPEVRRAGSGPPPTNAWAPYLSGDSARGHALFFDVDGTAACAKCHLVDGRGGEVGPELTGIAGTRTAQFIVESILEPNAEIASGYESVLIQTASGRLVDGVIRRETGDSIWIATSEAEELAIAVKDIARRRTQEVSLMPGNLADLLSVNDLHDLLAYLSTLQ